MPNTALPKLPPLPELRRDIIRESNREGYDGQTISDIIEIANLCYRQALENNRPDDYAILTASNIIGLYLESFDDE